ncbi:hypothetical protein KAM466_37620 [Aeromonas caviae]|nr:hypothetical protein KAM466_37620 [Aeromonas caviae]
MSPHSTHSRPKAETQSRPWASNVERGAILIEPGDAGLRIRAEREQGPWYRRGGPWWQPQVWGRE